VRGFFFWRYDNSGACLVRSVRIRHLADVQESPTARPICETLTPSELKDWSVIPWITLDTAQIPGGGGKLYLKQRGSEFSITLDRDELMNSRLSGSEEALATIACERLRDNKAPQILIGGLGMGFTLRAALAALGPKARITVAELVPAVLVWAHGPMAKIFGSCLTDSRVHIQETDVGHLIQSNASTFDAILLDVDNGPQGLTQKANDALYDLKGLSASRTALRPGGIVAVWSSGPNPKFIWRARKAGFNVDEVKVRANGSGGGARHVIWIAARVDHKGHNTRGYRTSRPSA
jgi:hypothetical protein